MSAIRLACVKNEDFFAQQNKADFRYRCSPSFVVDADTLHRILKAPPEQRLFYGSRKYFSFFFFVTVLFCDQRAWKLTQAAMNVKLKLHCKVLITIYRTTTFWDVLISGVHSK